MKRTLSGLLLVTLLASLTALWFGTLDYRRLVRPDEGRYAEIPREMVASGDWITPRLNGIKYFEKPALQYWATAASFEIFGEHQWSARLWPAITGFLGILLAWYTGRRLWGNAAGMLAGGMLASALLYNVMAHVITLDMGLSFFLQLAITGFIFAQQDDARASQRWMWTAWIALALAVLSKGIVAIVLTGGTLVVYTVLNRDAGPWRRFRPVSGLLIFLAIAAPWFIAVSLANPEFAHFFFIHEHFERFLTKAHRRYQPDWYFVPIFLIGALPWSFMWIHGLLKRWPRRVQGAFSPERFLTVWVVMTFLFFSFSNSKLAPYIIPIFPALALLSAKFMIDASRRTVLIHLGLMLAVALPGVMLAPRLAQQVDNEYTPTMMNGLAHDVTATAALWVGVIVVAMAVAFLHRRRLALAVLAMGSLATGTGVLFSHDNLAPFSSGYDSAQRLIPLVKPDVPFYSVQKYEQTLPFYLKRTVTLVDYQDEMAFGLTQEPEKWIPTVDEFKQRWLQDQDAFALLAPPLYWTLKAENFPMELVASDPRCIYVRKPGHSSPSTPHAQP